MSRQQRTARVWTFPCAGSSLGPSLASQKGWKKKMGFENWIRPLRPQLSFRLNHGLSTKTLVMSYFGIDQIDNGNSAW